MNVGRLALAAVAATIVDAVYGFVVYGTLLMSRFEALPAVYRQGADAQAHMAYIFCGTLLAMSRAGVLMRLMSIPRWMRGCARYIPAW